MITGKQNCNNRRWKESEEKRRGKKEAKIKENRNRQRLQRLTRYKKKRKKKAGKKMERRMKQRAGERFEATKQFGLSWEGSVHPTHIEG